MGRGVSKVVGRDQPVSTQLSLKTEGPLGNLHVRGIKVHCIDGGEARPREITRKAYAVAQRKRIPAGIAGPWIGKIHVTSDDPWSSCWGSVDHALHEKSRGSVIESATGNADRRTTITGDIPRETEAWRKIQPLLVQTSGTRKSGIAFVGNARW